MALALLRFLDAPSPLVMLWLGMILMACMHFRLVSAVCLHCLGNVAGCTGTATCPLVAGVSDNASALVGAASTLVVVNKLLPTKFMRVLSRSALDTIKALFKATAVGFDFTGKTIAEVFEAAQHGKVTPTEATIHLQKMLMDETTNAVITKISKTMDVIKELEMSGSLTVEATQGVDGAFLYLWALTHDCIQSGKSTILHASGEGPKSKSKAHSAKLVRPTTAGEFWRRLNIWAMLLHATGAGNALMTTRFLDDVVYSLLARGKDWRVVHELFLVYLMAVEEDDDKNLGNIYNSGGQDTKLKEAEANAEIHFGILGNSSLLVDAGKSCVGGDEE